MINREEIQKIIEENFNTKWWVEDFLEGYMNAHEINSEEEMTEENWEEFERIMTADRLEGFKEVVIQKINERITYFCEGE